MRKAIIIIAALALLGMAAWGLVGGFERVTAERIETALTDKGVPQPVAACMGTRLAERLDIDQLRQLESLGDGPEGKPASTVELLDNIRRIEDRELVEVVGTTAAICSFTAG